MPKSSMNTLYYYCYVFTLVLLGFVFAVRWDCRSKHPFYSNVGHLTRWDGLADRKQKNSTEYGIENPRVDGSIPSQATKQERSSSQGCSENHSLGPKTLVVKQLLDQH
jgi:hypothetical protein